MNQGYIDPAYGIKSQRGQLSQVPLVHESEFYLTMNQDNQGLCKIN